MYMRSRLEVVADNLAGGALSLPVVEVGVGVGVAAAAEAA
jgi:hypothetical protein